MQHPVGFHYNPRTGRAELNDFLAVLTNPVALAAFPRAEPADRAAWDEPGRRPGRGRA